VLRQSRTIFQSFPTFPCFPCYLRGRETSRSSQVNQFRVKAFPPPPPPPPPPPKEGTVPRAGRTRQVRRESGCLKEKRERRVSASMHDPMAGRRMRERKSGRGRPGRKGGLGRGRGREEENWMKHGSANAVCSFRATGLCNLFANPGYCGTTRGSACRSGAATTRRWYSVPAGSEGTKAASDGNSRLCTARIDPRRSRYSPKRRAKTPERVDPAMERSPSCPVLS